MQRSVEQMGLWMVLLSVLFKFLLNLRPWWWVGGKGSAPKTPPRVRLDLVHPPSRPCWQAAIVNNKITSDITNNLWMASCLLIINWLMTFIVRVC